MELGLLLGKEIIVMLLMALLGLLTVRAGLLKAADSKILSVVLVYLVMPCVILNAFQVKVTEARTKGLAIGFIAAILIHVVFIGITLIVGRFTKISNVMKASLIFTNSGNLIIPLVTGALGAEMVFYTCAYTIIQMILMWTYGVTLIGEDKRVDWKRLLSNVNFIIIIIGMILFGCGIQLPGMVDNVISRMSSLIGPLSMIMIGMMVGGIELKKVFVNKSNYIFCILRLIIYPLIIICLFKITGMTKWADDQNLLIVSVLAAAAPSAASVTNISQIVGKNSEQAATLNIASLLLCTITLPLIISLYVFMI